MKEPNKKESLDKDTGPRPFQERLIAAFTLLFGHTIYRHLPTFEQFTQKTIRAGMKIVSQVLTSIPGC